MYVIGITGGIGTGKSTVAALLREAGLKVFDADQISHSVTSQNGVALPEICELFGDNILNEQGELDREQISKLVFSDKKKLDQLSLIVHHHVLAEIASLLQQAETAKEHAVALDVPIPVKRGFLDRCNSIWVVTATLETRLKRLAERGMPETEALRRINMQMTDAEYEELATYLLTNNDNFLSLRRQVNCGLEKELTSRGIPFHPLT